MNTRFNITRHLGYYFISDALTGALLTDIIFTSYSQAIFYANEITNK